MPPNLLNGREPSLDEWRHGSAAAAQVAQVRDTDDETALSENRMQLSEVIGALSYALDLTEGQPPGHSLRCAWIGMHVGQALALDPHQLSDLYYTLLLKDAGCSSNAARLWELYGGDERVIKHNYKRWIRKTCWPWAGSSCGTPAPVSRCAVGSSACSTLPATPKNWRTN